MPRDLNFVKSLQPIEDELADWTRLLGALGYLLCLSKRVSQVTASWAFLERKCTKNCTKEEWKEFLNGFVKQQNCMWLLSVSLLFLM